VRGIEIILFLIDKGLEETTRMTICKSPTVKIALFDKMQGYHIEAWSCDIVSYLCNYDSGLKGIRQGGVVIHVACMENSGVFESRTGSETADSFPSAFCRRDQSQCSLLLLAAAIPLSM
jgi:hypothetical protein